jgi:glycosyltransferase involved in cell wall biosynthesis
VWGLLVNEAMAAGLPVLGSVYAQAVEELVQDG